MEAPGQSDMQAIGQEGDEGVGFDARFELMKGPDREIAFEVLSPIARPGLARRPDRHPTGEGWLYLAAVLDLHTRKIVGWSMRETLQTQIALEALTGDGAATPGTWTDM
jgi:transposase InsO family protein